MMLRVGRRLRPRATTALRRAAAAPPRRKLATKPGTLTGSDGLPVLYAGEVEAAPTLVEAVVERVRTPLENLLDRCTDMLTAYPLRTNAVISCGLCSLGDALAQFTEWKMDIMSPGKEERGYNFARTGRMAVFGFFICGPLLSVWYRTLGLVSGAFEVGYRPLVRGRVASLLERVAPNWEATLHLKRERKHSPSGLLIGKVIADTVPPQPP